MSEYLPKREKALEEHAVQLSRVRRCSVLEAWQAIRSQALANLADSRDSSMEATWQIDLDILDRRIAAESGFSAVGADRRWQ